MLFEHRVLLYNAKKISLVICMKLHGNVLQPRLIIILPMLEKSQAYASLLRETCKKKGYFIFFYIFPQVRTFVICSLICIFCKQY